MSREVLKMSPLAAHELWSSTYDHTASPVLLLEERAVERIVEQFVEQLLPSTERSLVLDVACGTGRWLEKFAVRGLPAVGLDLSTQMLGQGKRRPGLSQKLIQADCRAIPLAGGSVTLAICSFCIGYLPDVRELAKELARVVRTGGHLVLSDFHPGARTRGWKRSFRQGNTVVEILSFDHPLDRIRDAFAQEGFQVVRCEEPRFSEQDRSAFDQCGRGDLFSGVQGEVAVFVCLFSREKVEGGAVSHE